MIMHIKGAVKEMYFTDIPQGDFFAPFPNTVYLKVEDVIANDGSQINAIDMEGGHMAHFDETRKVYPLNSEVNISYRHYEYEIEN